MGRSMRGKPPWPRRFAIHGARPFQHLYDFGDAWEHSVKIEQAAPTDPQLTYPRILKAIGERPPDDFGGPYGYAEMLKALLCGARIS